MKTTSILIFIFVFFNSIFAYNLDSAQGSGVNGIVSNSNYELNSGFVYLLTGGDQTGVEESIPLQFELCHNYPNPFNPVTTIQYTLPNDQFVKLSVYNIKGEVVSELVNGNVKAGMHRVNFDGNDLVSGQYFYKIDTQGFSKIRKMLLIK